VLDADALTSFAEAPERLLNDQAAEDVHVVLTPHEGEFPRLFSDIATSIPALQTGAGRDAAERRRRGVPAEGTGHGVASPDGRASIASNAPARLATAGPATCWRYDRRVSGARRAGIRGRLHRVWMHGEAARERDRADRRRSAGGAAAVFRRLYDEFGIEY